MKGIALALGLLALAACGADGPPERPAPGITLSGTAEIGIQGGNR